MISLSNISGTIGLYWDDEGDEGDSSTQEEQNEISWQNRVEQDRLKYQQIMEQRIVLG